MKEDKNIEILRVLFGDNRAEWPSEHFKDLFVEPTYQSKLQSMRPCFLVGGRGTGKTTSLQSLTFETTLNRLENTGLNFGDQEYLGVLVRMNKNRVHAFQGRNLPIDEWQRVFAHYFNILVCLELAKLGIWLETKNGKLLSAEHVNHISESLCINPVDSLKELSSSLKREVTNLEKFVNNPKSNLNYIASMAESPLRVFVEALRESGLSGDRVFFCCIDEYENLLDYQQAVINTYIKHTELPLSYKVGVRINGIRNRHTKDKHDLLRTPDDYAQIEIAEEGFDYFARAVAESRLRCAIKNGVNISDNLEQFLSDLSFEEEAELLGCKKITDDVIEELKRSYPESVSYFQEKPSSEVYFLRYWQDCTKDDISVLAKDWMDNDALWSTRLGNYSYASLFWLSKGRKGARIRKYYCGTRVFLSLSAGNIRYFLELIDGAINQQLNMEVNGCDQDKFFITPKAQTNAVKEVGRRRLNQIESIADHGVQLKRLVLAIGKIFFEFARTPSGRAPEVSSFVLSGDKRDIEDINKLLVEGVGNLAFEASPRTKATSDFEIRDDEYRLHRIFCGFFEISHRKKRRITFDAKKLLDVLEDKPNKAISSLLESRSQTNELELPEQLAFFSDFYSGKDD